MDLEQLKLDAHILYVLNDGQEHDKEELADKVKFHHECYKSFEKALKRLIVNETPEGKVWIDEGMPFVLLVQMIQEDSTDRELKREIEILNQVCDLSDTKRMTIDELKLHTMRPFEDESKFWAALEKVEPAVTVEGEMVISRGEDAAFNYLVKRIVNL